MAKIPKIIILGEELPPLKRIEELELTDAAFGIHRLPKLRKQQKQHVLAEDLLERSL